jgi:hypothetical protein
MNQKVGSILCAALLLGCETSPKVEAMKRRYGGVPVFNSFVFDDRFSFTDSVHTHVDLPETSTRSRSIGISGAFGSETVEGSLDVLLANHSEILSAPEYRLLFLRYEEFKRGAQQSSQMRGIESVAIYLAELRLPVGVIIKIIGHLLEKQSVSIPNILMPVQHLEAYGY